MNRLANILSAIITKLNGDNTWKTLTTGIYYRKNSGIVSVQIENLTSTQTSGSQILGTLPDGYKPSRAVQMFIRRGASPASGWISSTGAITWSATTGTGLLAGFTSFPVE